MGKLNKDIAQAVAKSYASNNVNCREDILKIYPAFNLTLRDVSKCIYFCIFFDLITRTEELKIALKLNENMKKHSPNVANISKKYLETLYDKRLLDSYNERLKPWNELLDIINSLEDRLSFLRHELDFINNLNYNDFICSADEDSYVPPRTKDEVTQEIKDASEYLNFILKNHSKDEIMQKIQYFEGLIKNLKNKYNI